LNPRPGWIQEFWRLVVLMLLAWAAGSVVDQVYLFLLLALLAYSLRNLYNLRRLAIWLGNPKFADIPIHFGLWGDVYSKVARVSLRQAQREKRLAELVNEYTASTSALPDGAVALDSSGRIRWFNDAATRLLGLQPAKDIGQPLLNLCRNPEMVSFVRNPDYARVLQISAPGDSERQLEMRIAPYGDDQTLLLAQDITERLRHERMRKDFVANVSHELRTPLTVIGGFIENLQMDENLQNDRMTRPLELMAQQTARMGRIVEDLLLLARLESDSNRNQSDRVDIGELIRNVADECQALADDVPRIDCEVTSTRHVLGDEKQLRSVVTNLVVNAINHTSAEQRVDLSWRDEGAQSLLEVRDNGIGIAPEHIPRLTERFYRVDAGRSRDRGGTGLGLAIVKHILHHHDAKLEIQSRPQEGSRFVCRFSSSQLVD
jgi:two-component system phosphate regulon sensor histidine kinase PhoR